MTRLMTAKQVAEEFGLPSDRTLRTMRANGLPAVRLGKAFLFDMADVAQFIQDAKETTCPDRTKDRASPESRGARASTSAGMSRGASDSNLLARQTADKLKRLSPSSSGNDNPDPETGRVIRGRFP